jgi:ATP-dependent Lon protease
MKLSEDTFPKFKKNRLSMIPLRDIVVFPHMVLPFFVGRKKSIRAVEDAMVNGRIIFLTTQRDKQASEPGEDDICRVGTVARILQMLKLPDGTVRLLVEGYERAHIVKYSEQKNLFRVHVKPIKETQELTSEIIALIRTVKSEFYTFAALYKKIPAEVITKIEKLSVPDILIDTICAHAPMNIEKKIELLTETDQKKRLENCAYTLASERNLVDLEQKMQNKIKKRIEKTQKNFFLNEQLKEIQRELGKEHDDPAGARELEQKLEKKGLPEEVFARCKKELKRLTRLQPMSPEAGVIRTYLEWISDIPWKEMTEDNRDIECARRILDEDHYNLKKVKERILDFIAVCQFTEKIKGPILCFVGPPGTGKTSLGRSVARALNRKFIRISLGGVRDEAEIRGHRKTYIGALPGKIIQSMKKAGTKNPVFLLDEVDKMSQDYRGDPAAALLEVLDPEQNNTFMDHYLEVQYDLSHVMFITTANSVHNIPYALIDRMEIIHISGYSEYEKENIAADFLVPKQLKENGLEWADIQFHKNALLTIIRKYTMESGVRNLEREIANIIRKIARDAVKKGIHLLEDEKKEYFRIRVTQKNLHRFLGREKYRENLFLQDNKSGLAYGLAWTEKGGLLLPVEVALLAGKGDFILTGSLGDVMKESAQAAFSFLRAHADVFKIEKDAFKKKDIHIHVPAGSIPKDGPSAGITVTAAILSALKGVPVKKGYAMTGEITLTGRMLPIGGVKEKVLAAHRNKMTHILLPEDNRKDIDELPGEVTSSSTFIFTDSVTEGLFHMFDGF